MTREEKAAEEDGAAVHGDVLEAILALVPLVDLIPAGRVSRSWKRAVSSSLFHLNTIKPWLIVYAQNPRFPHATTTHAYDPRSHVWIEIQQPPIDYVSALRASHSNLLYMLSPSKLSFSFDPLHMTWHHTGCPLVWRTDPIVALVGSRIVIAGGACSFEDDPLAVEMYDVRSRTWHTCQSMPAILRDSAASTWLSIAVDGHKLFVTERASGVTHSFDPDTNTWQGPYYLRPNQSVFFSTIGFAGNRLILVALLGDAENVRAVNLYEVNYESFEREEIGEMPAMLLEKLRSEDSPMPSIAVSMAEDYVYMHNPWEPDEVVFCELAGTGSGVSRWGSVRNSIANDRSRMERLVCTCSKVGIDDLERALRSENRRFVVKSIE